MSLQRIKQSKQDFLLTFALSCPSIALAIVLFCYFLVLKNKISIEPMPLSGDHPQTILKSK